MTAVDYRLSNIAWSIATVIFIAITSYLLGRAAALIARWRGETVLEQRKIATGFTFAGPWIIGFLIFVIGPALVSLYLSFTTAKIGDPVQWIGLANYRTLLVGHSTEAQGLNQAMLNSFYYAIVGVPLQILAALGMAMLLNRELPLIRGFRTIFYLPVILAGGPALLLAWRYMLTSNGGFINIILRKIADLSPLFGFLYKAMIYLVETFDGFYTGLTRGDPVGPLAYALPALVGLLALLTLVRGGWSESKRTRALRVIELVVLVIVYALGFKGLVADPIDLSWTYFASAATVVFIMINAAQGKTARVRLWQIAALVLFAIGIVATLVNSRFSFAGDTGSYLLAMVIGAVPLVFSLVGSWTRRKFLILGGMLAVLAIIIFVRLIPGQLDGGQLSLLVRYPMLQTAVKSPAEVNPEKATDPNFLKNDYVDYLKTGLPNSSLSPLWIWGLVAVVLGGIVVLDNRYPRARQVLMYAGLIFFLLFTIGALRDGVAYFRAFSDSAQQAGSPVYHFTLFRRSIATFPGDDRRPLWMDNELWSKPSLILITLWSSGAGMLIFLAALKGVPPQLYEAAEVDGANRIQRFFSITLPMISPALFYNLIIGVIAALQTFDTIYIMVNNPGGNLIIDQIQSAAYFLYARTFQQGQIGEGAAISWILAIIILTATVLQFRYSNWVHYEV
ncbi:MAG TPA: ABC transporter permease subunit [Aggregatilineales bacterium]|nr:ABC transporter permease subunit [Aggregatilineales bacterium]